MADKRFPQKTSKSNSDSVSEKPSSEKKLDEFGIIEQFFKTSQSNNDHANGIMLGIGDDAAELALNSSRLVVATDTLNTGIHFPDQSSPADIASRAVAVNLSDFAAMGAVPRWATLSISMPINKIDDDQGWIRDFSKALLSALADYAVSLVGGDTTKGSLAISLTILGEPFGERLLRREQAEVGDDIWLSGYPGLGAASLDCVLDRNERFLMHPNQEQQAFLKSKFYKPVPRLELGQSLTSCANAAIDISDGLIGDAGHIAKQSQCCMSIQSSRLPIHPLLKSLYDAKKQQGYILAGGDDYELLFTAKPDRRSAIESISQNQSIPLTRIGVVKDEADKPGIELLNENGEFIQLDSIGYRHF